MTRRDRRPSKHSQHELRRLVRQAVESECDPERQGLALFIDAVEPKGRPPETLTVWATLHFLAVGSPFCCGEPGCHLGLWGEALDRVSEQVRHAMGLSGDLRVEFRSIGVQYHDGIRFVHSPDP